MLELLDRYFEKRGDFWFALYLCFCGDLAIKRPDRVKTGKTRSCGCLKNLHGMSAHPLNKVFSGMKQRCHNPNSDSYKNYGARGIYVCDEWRQCGAVFFNWAKENGWKPELTIDRTDNDGPYSPDNCRFVPQHINNQNSRNAKLNISKVKNILDMIYKGDDYKDIAKEHEISVTVIYNIASGQIWKNVKRRTENV